MRQGVLIQRKTTVVVELRMYRFPSPLLLSPLLALFFGGIMVQGLVKLWQGSWRADNTEILLGVCFEESSPVCVCVCVCCRAGRRVRVLPPCLRLSGEHFDNALIFCLLECLVLCV